MINNLFTFDLDKKIILIKNKNNKNRFSLKEKASIYRPKFRPSNLSPKNIINSNEERLDLKNINTKNKEINSKLSLNQKLKIKKKKKKLRDSATTFDKNIINKISSLNLKNEDNNSNKNSLEYDISNMEYREEKDIEKEKDEQKLITKIKINRFDICFFLLCIKKRKKIEKILINEGMNLIIKKLDIINIFNSIYNNEKIQEKLNDAYDDIDKITYMSNKSKKDLNIIYK